MALSLIVTGDNYPTADAPNFGTFLSALVEAWASAGAHIDVIAPMARITRPPLRLVRSAPEPLPTPEGVRAFHPLYTSLSNRRFGPVSARELGVRSFVRAAARVAKQLEPSAQLVYGHFLYRGGAAALSIGDALGLPKVVALGESSFDDYERDLGLDRVRVDLARFDGVVCVADWIRDRCVDRYGVAVERIRVFPNAVDTERFRPLERETARRRLGLPPDRPIVTFVGHFIDRKGPLRVLEAIRDMPEVGVAFVGDGPERPRGSQVLHAAPARHEDIPLWLAAADVFALPTREEGSCNAVVEAMACGRAIVTSDIPSIREQTGDDAARLVDASSVPEIAAAIAALLANDEERAALGQRARARAECFSLPARAAGILSWLEELAARGATRTAT